MTSIVLISETIHWYAVCVSAVRELSGEKVVEDGTAVFEAVGGSRAEKVDLDCVIMRSETGSWSVEILTEVRCSSVHCMPRRTMLVDL